MLFSPFLSTSFVFFAVLYASAVSAHPLVPGHKHATHRVREISTGVKLETYHPKGTFKVRSQLLIIERDHLTFLQTYGVGRDHPLQKRGNVTYQESAAAFVQTELGLGAGDLVVRSSSQTKMAKHVFIQQQMNGIPFANAVANVALNNDDKVVVFGNCFVKPSEFPIFSRRCIHI